MLESPMESGAGSSAQAKSPPHRWLPWTVAAVAIVAAGAVSFLHFREAAPQAAQVRFTIPPPELASTTSSLSFS